MATFQTRCCGSSHPTQHNVHPLDAIERASFTAIRPSHLQSMRRRLEPLCPRGVPISHLGLPLLLPQELVSALLQRHRREQPSGGAFPHLQHRRVPAQSEKLQPYFKFESEFETQLGKRDVLFVNVLHVVSIFEIVVFIIFFVGRGFPCVGPGVRVCSGRLLARGGASGA